MATQRPLSYSIEALNVLNIDDAKYAFANCCTATRWVNAMACARPFSSLAQCQTMAKAVWATMSESDYIEAFEGHPKIGDISSLREKYAHTKQLASGEQGAVKAASEETIEALAAANHAYETKNGFIFIVCATGKSADEMHEILQERLQNDRATELENAAAQQALITEIRINKMIKANP